jgi:TetR/AcrR family acrAB operon transcriptional repressor
MSGVKDRVSQMKCNCVDRAEQAITHAMARGLLPATLDARLAAVGLDALIYGLISNWLADGSYVDLERDCEALIDRYLASLKLDLRKPARGPSKRRGKATAASA